MWNPPGSHGEASHAYLVTSIPPEGPISAQALARNALPGRPLTVALEIPDSNSVAVVAPDVYPLFLDALGGLTKTLEPSIPTALFLVPRHQPPATESRKDGNVTSFLCSAGVFRQLFDRHSDSSPERLSFLLLSAILNGEILVDRLIVSQLPMQAPKATAPAAEGARIIVPHRGFARDLRVALRSIDVAAAPKPAVSVGLDGGSVTKYQTLRQHHPGVDFLHFSPPPVGPYVIRQELIQRSAEPLLIFQDSDDFATWDRFARLREELHACSCDLIGSHELRVDQTSGSVDAVRFPLDVNAALHAGPGHALLHGTSAVTRSGFFKAGGLSTDKIFGADTQFLLRAYFTLRIRNVDAFLYVRRVHKQALTAHPSTGHAAPVRQALVVQKREDFEAVKRGQVRMEDSSLHPVHRSEPYQVRSL